jgi:hypothetical protein
VALIQNSWSGWPIRDQHREVITSGRCCCRRLPAKSARRPDTLLVSSTHGEQQTARRPYLRIAQFFARLRKKAEQLDAVQRWYRILSEHCENICAAGN